MLASAGCSGMQQVEAQNRGPGAVTVVFRFQHEGARAEEIEVKVPGGGAELKSLWFGGPPARLEVEARWATAVRRQVFLPASLPAGLAKHTSAGGIHGLHVSPERIAWTSPTLWVQMQSTSLIPLWIVAGMIVLRLLIRSAMSSNRAPTPTPSR